MLACAFLWLFGDVLANLFLDTSAPEQISAIRSNAHMFLIGNSLFYIPLAAVNVFRFTIQGLSYSMLAVFAGVFEMVARSVMGFCLVPVLGYPAVCFASPTAWIAAMSSTDSARTLLWPLQRRRNQKSPPLKKIQIPETFCRLSASNTIEDS